MNVKQSIALLLVLFAFQFVAHSADILNGHPSPMAMNSFQSVPPLQLVFKTHLQVPTNSPPSTAANFFRLLPSLMSTNYGVDGTGWNGVGKAAAQIMELGTSVLPVLLAEMNKTHYLSDDASPRRVIDHQWLMRMRLAHLVEDISREDFKCKSTVHCWSRDYSFNAINDWWTNKVLQQK
jgi:hypothetical protein